jgi:membrane-bound lytic murein transglycosylase B
MKIITGMLKISFFISCSFAMISCSQLCKPKKPSAKNKTPPLYQQAEVKKFINKMVAQYNFKHDQLINIFKHAQIKKEILGKTKHPYKEVPWYEYQQRFLTQQRINDGVKFWHKHAATLRHAQKKYGVPANIIVAIIGIESQYGKDMGKFKVVNALSTLGFKYTKRAKYFRKELAQFLLLCREKHLNPLKVYGSYAGAIGEPQFMPSNFRQYAVNFNNSNSVDIIHNPKDAIVSVANFFQAHGWLHGKEIASKTRLKHTAHHKPSHALANIIKLQGKKGPSYWLGFHNMYVITSYNTNIQYAMAAYQLSQAINKAYLHSLHHKKIAVHHQQNLKQIKKA